MHSLIFVSRGHTYVPVTHIASFPAASTLLPLRLYGFTYRSRHISLPHATPAYFSPIAFPYSCCFCLCLCPCLSCSTSLFLSPLARSFRVYYCFNASGHIKNPYISSMRLPLNGTWKGPFHLITTICSQYFTMIKL